VSESNFRGRGCAAEREAMRRIESDQRPRRRGFTLIELIVVIVVLGLLAGLVAPQIFGRVSEAKAVTARTQIELLATALDSYRLDNGGYPTTAQGLAALTQAPTSAPVPTSWRGPYLRKAVPLDPWGRAYVYASPGERNPRGFDLHSLGRDGQVGGEGEDADVVGQ
jgi:general secretion pathway protein G